MREFRLGWLIAFGACAAGVPDPPSPIEPPGRPAIEDRTVLLPLPAAAPTLSIRRTAPSLPYPAPRIEWWPTRPRQASALAIRVLQPAGPALAGVEASVAGRSIALAPTRDGWIGIAGLPLDSAGFHTVQLRFTRSGTRDSLVRLVPVAPRTYASSRIRLSAGAASDPEVDARIERERRIIRTVIEGSRAGWLPTAPFDWPRPPVRTSPFGQRRMFNGSVASRHLGLDLRGVRGAPVYAPAAGRVVLTGNFYYQGNAVYLDHGLGLVTAYFHFSSTAVREGELVEAGQLIGGVGSTGRSTAPHLHWSVYVGGENIDPESLIGFTLQPPRETASAGVER